MDSQLLQESRIAITESKFFVQSGLSVIVRIYELYVCLSSGPTSICNTVI